MYDIFRSSWLGNIQDKRERGKGSGKMAEKLKAVVVVAV